MASRLYAEHTGVRTGELPWTKLDDLHRMTLEQILVDFGVPGITEEEKDFGA